MMKNKIDFAMLTLAFLVMSVFVSGQTVGRSKPLKEKIKIKGNARLESVKTVEKMFAAFNRRDADALAAVYAEDVYVDAPDYRQPKRKRAEVAAHYREMFRQSPDIRDDVKSITASGNRVFVEFVSTGTIENPSTEMPPSVKGKKFSLKIASILEVKNGKIVRDVTYYDRLLILKQMGLMPE